MLDYEVCILQTPILAYAYFQLPFLLYTDASQTGLGAVLTQVQEGRERVIPYASRSLRPTEKDDKVQPIQTKTVGVKMGHGRKV